jgi:hypothetical protein
MFEEIITFFVEKETKNTNQQQNMKVRAVGCSEILTIMCHNPRYHILKEDYLKCLVRDIKIYISRLTVLVITIIVNTLSFTHNSTNHITVHFSFFDSKFWSIVTALEHPRGLFLWAKERVADNWLLISKRYICLWQRLSCTVVRLVRKFYKRKYMY